jgi:hypothetical protein
MLAHEQEIKAILLIFKLHFVANRNFLLITFKNIILDSNGTTGRKK